jgi:hypothetical protein
LWSSHAKPGSAELHTTLMLPKILSTAGLVFDIGGAWLVAIEVIKRFEGERVGEGFESPYEERGRPTMTRDYEHYERSRHQWMLTVGFMLQNSCPLDLIKLGYYRFLAGACIGCTVIVLIVTLRS